MPQRRDLRAARRHRPGALNRPSRAIVAGWNNELADDRFGGCKDRWRKRYGGVHDSTSAFQNRQMPTDGLSKLVFAPALLCPDSAQRPQFAEELPILIPLPAIQKRERIKAC
ncbi:predicted protein [Chaetomium globosum CBS 148.51]|uniref:Uncharacterized protein n=1 Tax=Chaetomium globosum (strain ATCC 6205 / CBS 148.51 / DSM 1962 / NBRC 6347 / NRRL 1970) TaxID=306901 RepID=Q2H4M1_CHAGB|nr:uncharacterized protein CHGG_06394 [Chaetomium globosum CBS 148.51]EAQ89775.1 predicted protein [Chaetomium globosum CBS 148.51]